MRSNPPPWAHFSPGNSVTVIDHQAVSRAGLPPLDAEAFLGFTATICMNSELADARSATRWELGIGSAVAPNYLSALIGLYISQRVDGTSAELEDLPVPTEFRKLFRDWAERRVNFVEVANE